MIAKIFRNSKVVGAKVLLCVFICLFFALGRVFAYPPITGSFTAPSNPWSPSGDIIITSTGRLTIPAGYTVSLDAGARIQVQNSGILKVLGTSTSPVVITSTSSSRFDYIGKIFRP